MALTESGLWERPRGKWGREGGWGPGGGQGEGQDPMQSPAMQHLPLKSQSWVSPAGRGDPSVRHLLRGQAKEVEPGRQDSGAGFSGSGL